MKKELVEGIVSSKKGFVISDICYVLSDDIYFNLWGKKKKFADGIFEINGFSFAVGSTAYGDGIHYDNACHKYSVDAGVIGLVPLELVTEKEGSGLGAVFNIPGEAKFKSENGIFNITLPDGQNIHIDTANAWDDGNDEDNGEK